jgi:hypothetical protein
MPALVNRRVGSLRGTSGEEGTMVWPRSAKKSRNPERTSARLVLAVLVRLLSAPLLSGWLFMAPVVAGDEKLVIPQRGLA